MKRESDLKREARFIKECFSYLRKFEKKTGVSAGDDAQELANKLQDVYASAGKIIEPRGVERVLRPGAWLGAAAKGCYVLGTAAFYLGSPVGGAPFTVTGGMLEQLADVAESSRERLARRRAGIESRHSVVYNIADSVGVNPGLVGRAGRTILPLISGVWGLAHSAYARRNRVRSFEKDVAYSLLKPK